MRIYNGKIDTNDLERVYRLRKEMPIAARPCPLDDKGKIAPNTSKFFFKDGTITSIFHIKPIYYLHLKGDWRPLSEITYGFGNTWAVLKENWGEHMDPSYLRWYMERMKRLGGRGVSMSAPYWFLQPILAITTNFFPDPGDPAANAIDGMVGTDITVDTWTGLRDRVNGVAKDTTGTSIQIVIRATTTASNFDRFQRGYTLFPTSSIGSGSTITAATYSLWGVNAITNNWPDSVSVVTVTPASNTTLALADFSQTATVLQATALALSSWVTAAYNTITLNATGQGNISKTSITKFGFKSEKDRANDSTWTSGNATIFDAASADTAGTSNDPQLAVTYTTGGGPKLSLLLGVGS